MTQYDRTNSGALFKNDRKERETHADYRGHINVAGQEYWLSAWLKKDRNGRTFMSLSVQPKEGAPKQPSASAGAAADLDDDLPF